MEKATESERLREKFREENGMEPTERDADGRVILHMTVRDDSDFLSPYCGDKPVISSEVADYLDNAASAYPGKNAFALYIKSDVITDEEARVYDAAIRNFYRNRMKMSRRDVSRNRFVGIAMLVIGVLVFSLLFFLEHRGLGEMMDNILGIAAWVFVAEAIELFFLERHKLIAEHRMSEKFVNADIRFMKDQTRGEI